MAPLARKPMFRAPLWSAFIEWPHAVQTNCDWDFRLALSRCPHAEQVCDVYLASTATTGTPDRLALYSTYALSWAKDHPECRLRCFFLTVILSRMWVKSSRPIPRQVPLAMATMALLMTWF